MKNMKKRRVKVRKHKRKLKSGNATIVRAHKRKLNGPIDPLKKSIIKREFYGELARDVPLKEIQEYYSDQLLDYRDKKYGSIPLTDFIDKDWECLKKANDLISGRVLSEVKNSRAPTDGTIIMWFNSSKSWAVGNFQKLVNAGEKMELMPNEIFVPFPIETVKRSICYFKDFSLYYSSLEAKQRGEVSDKEALDIWLNANIKNIFK